MNLQYYEAIDATLLCHVFDSVFDWQTNVGRIDRLHLSNDSYNCIHSFIGTKLARKIVLQDSNYSFWSTYGVVVGCVFLYAWGLLVSLLRSAVKAQFGLLGFLAFLAHYGAAYLTTWLGLRYVSISL